MRELAIYLAHQVPTPLVAVGALGLVAWFWWGNGGTNA